MLVDYDELSKNGGVRMDRNWLADLKTQLGEK